MLYIVALENAWRKTTYRYFCKVYKLSEIEGVNKKEIIKLSLAVSVFGSAWEIPQINAGARYMCIETELQKFSVSFESFNGIVWTKTDK